MYKGKTYVQVGCTPTQHMLELSGKRKVNVENALLKLAVDKYVGAFSSLWTDRRRPSPHACTHTHAHAHTHTHTHTHIHCPWAGGSVWHEGNPFSPWLLLVMVFIRAGESKLEQHWKKGNNCLQAKERSLRRTNPANTLILNFLPPEMWANKHLDRLSFCYGLLSTGAQPWCLFALPSLSWEYGKTT